MNDNHVSIHGVLYEEMVNGSKNDMRRVAPDWSICFFCGQREPDGKKYTNGKGQRGPCPDCSGKRWGEGFVE